MPSPMAINPSTPPRSMFKSKPKSSSGSLSSAASYLNAVKQADLRMRSRSPTPTATPALSLSSSVTQESEDSVLRDASFEVDDNEDGLGMPRVPPTSEQVFTTVHTEFGHCANEEYRYKSVHPEGKSLGDQHESDPPYYILLTTYLSYIILIVIGHIRDFAGKRSKSSDYKPLMPHNGYAPLTSDFDSFYSRRIKKRIDECFALPTTGVAGRTIMLMDRYSRDFNHTFQYTGGYTRALNISSYNYLGFAQARGGCADAVEECLRRYGVSTCGARLDAGTSELHVAAEALVSRFVGTEDSLICSMGFATNSTIIPALVGRGCLVISDELNHSSIRFGVRLSGASVRMFKHNDMGSLETLLREVVSQGQPKTHRPWKKIMLIVEGLYSMEGTMVNLPGIMKLKRKYKFNLFVDEAHSIGALGPNGRGVCDYFGIDPRQVDILMGTFTKSFGAAGGYIASTKKVVDRLRLRGYAGAYAESMTPPVLTQVIASMASIMGVAPAPLSSSTSSVDTITPTVHPGRAPAALLPGWMTLPPALADGSEGRSRLRRLAFNSRYLSQGLTKLGFITGGHADSPIVPLLLFNPGKMPVFHAMMRERRTPIVIVTVGYPATALVAARVRFCVSAAHTKEDIDEVLTAVDQIGSLLDLKHGVPVGERWTLDQVLANTTELVNNADEVNA